MSAHRGPYRAEGNADSRVITYTGNRCSPAAANVCKAVFSEELLERRLEQIVQEERFLHLHHIDQLIFDGTVDFFRRIKAHWVNLPLTTRMISSPGEVYAGQKLNYTTDTLPIELNWFDSGDRIFLSESSQFYLELRLLIPGVDRVFSIYNSFRKEKADFCHLSEFQHIEFEGKTGFEENMKIATALLQSLTGHLSKYGREHLAYFLSQDELDSLVGAFSPENIETITFSDALALLYGETQDARYKEFSLRHFGAWEELRLTQMIGRHVWLTEYPLLQIPFYHNQAAKEVNGHPVAQNADLLPMGGREMIGSGQRIADISALQEKARQFNLPLADYAPYLQTRRFPSYQTTSGFGLGWQRMTHWLLKLPFIWEASHIPRGHLQPRP